jgi:hypothetical protein
MGTGFLLSYKYLKVRALASCLLAATVTFAGAVMPEPAEAEDSAATEIVERYVANTQAQQAGLRGIQMDMEIDASLPKLKKTGKMEALRQISKLGQITYQGLKFIGDNTIKNDVIVRYLTAEKQSQDMSAMAITPKNYKFKYKGVSNRDDKIVHVFQISPRKKQVGLFKGELWVDASTYLPVRESGRFVKNPSVFLKKVEFVREYQIRDGVALPSHIESTIDTRFWGQAQMSINYKNFARTDEEHAILTSSDSQ